MELRDYIVRLGLPNLGLPTSAYAVHFYAHPFMRLLSDSPMDNISNHLIPGYHTVAPQVVVLMIGADDIWFRPPSLIAASLYSVARYLLHAGCPKILICQSSTHFSVWFRDRMSIVESVLLSLLAEDDDSRVTFLQIPGFRTAPSFVLESDASLNLLGQFRLYQGVRRALNNL